MSEPRKEVMAGVCLRRARLERGLQGKRLADRHIWRAAHGAQKIPSTETDRFSLLQPRVGTSQEGQRSTAPHSWLDST